MGRRPGLPAAITAVVAGLEALVLSGYAISIAVVALTQGVQGPEAVASPTGVAVESVVFALFGIGMGLIAIGRWRRAGWTSVPFVLAQLLALTVGIPLVTASGGPRIAGVLTVLVALTGVGAVLAGRSSSEPGAVDARSREGHTIGPPRHSRH